MNTEKIFKEIFRMSVGSTMAYFQEFAVPSSIICLGRVATFSRGLRTERFLKKEASTGRGITPKSTRKGLQSCELCY
jgi:hypothetical protein